MAEATRWVGLDVHATQTTVAVLDKDTGELSRAKLRGAPEQAVVEFLAGFEGRVIAVYEAGPTGMKLARVARERGIDMRVCAPGLIPRKPTDRIKTDARDAERLVRQLAAGGLSFVRVPSEEEEALRDLVRAREDARQDLSRARHRLSKMLLRRGLRYEAGSTWTDRHIDWIVRLKFDDLASRMVVGEYVNAAGSFTGAARTSRPRSRSCCPRRRSRRPPTAAVLPWSGDAVGGRAVLRGRRLPSLRQALAAGGVPGDRPGRVHHRQQAPSGGDHQGGIQPRPPAAGRGRLALPAPARHRHHARSPPTGHRSARRGDRLARAAASAQALHADEGAQQARRRDHDRQRPRTGVLLLGGRHAGLTRPPSRDPDGSTLPGSDVHHKGQQAPHSIRVASVLWAPSTPDGVRSARS